MSWVSPGLAARRVGYSLLLVCSNCAEIHAYRSRICASDNNAPRFALAPSRKEVPCSRRVACGEFPHVVGVSLTPNAARTAARLLAQRSSRRVLTARAFADPAGVACASILNPRKSIFRPSTCE